MVNLPKSLTTTTMESRTIKRIRRAIPIIRGFFFILFIIFIIYTIVKFETTSKPLFQASNLIENPEFPISLTNPVTKRYTKPDFIIENAVYIPDFILLILTTHHKESNFRNVAENRIDCFYQNIQNSNRITYYPILSIDEYDSGRSRWIIRCPLPTEKSPASIGLRVYPHRKQGINWIAKMTQDQTVMSWGRMLVYEVAFDGEEIIAVFVKGLRLNGERKTDPSQFSCRFGSNVGPGLVTKAITAAQEVIRCPLPRGLSKCEELPVTIERGNSVLPSIAKLHNNNNNKKKKNKNKYELCACTMVWNQARFIKEWIMYHGYLGIQRWFIYDNNSDDELSEVIEELNYENYNVSRHIWPWIKSQEAGFAHCLLKARDRCNWIAFFDVDEFYYIPIPETFIDNTGRDSLRAIVQDVTKHTPTKGQIRTDCYNFGPSGLKRSPGQGVALGYTCRVKTYDRHKSIVRPEAVDESLLNRVHHFELKMGFSARSLHQRTAVINHYKYPVWDVFKAKFVRRVSAYVPDWQDKNNARSKDRTPGLGMQAIEPEDWHLRFCDVWDVKLRDYIMEHLVDPNTRLAPWQ